jgi:hypothetical protein
MKSIAIGHVGQRNTGRRLQQLRGDVPERALARHADGELAGVGLGVGDHVLQRRERCIGLGGDDQRRVCDQHDRLEILVGIVGHRLVHQPVLRDRARRREQQGVAVRWRLGDHRAADIATSAAAIFNDELLAERVAEHRRDHAGKHVGAAAGWERHHQGDRSGGPRLC